MYIYYTTMRPASPGAIPVDGLQSTETYNERRKLEDAGGHAVWSRLEYNRPLTDAELLMYEMVPGGMHRFWCIEYAYPAGDMYKLRSYRLFAVYAENKPLNLTQYHGSGAIVHEKIYFDSEHEALKFVDDFMPPEIKRINT